MAEIIKVFMPDKGVAHIRCPHCGSTKKISVDKLKGRKHTVKLRCSCGESFLAHLEFRKNYRKETELHGTYRITSEGGGGGTATISDLSKSGIAFSVSGMHNLRIGQKGTVDFVLDNRKSTRLNKEIVIKSIVGNRIGCEFSAHQPFEKDFGFYLQP